MHRLLRAGYPVSISTDDSSVFGTTASRELSLAAVAGGLTTRQLVALAAAPLDHAFETDDATMRAMRDEFAAATERALAACGCTEHMGQRAGTGKAPVRLKL